MSDQRVLNREIKSPIVQVRIHNGALLGEMSLAQALEKARELDQDLLLRGNPTDKAPLCEIRDMSQILYNEAFSAEMKRLQVARPKPAPGETAPITAGSGVLMEIPPEKLIAKWGEKRHRLEYSLLEGLDLPANSKAYLVKVGLPDPSSWAHDFEFNFEQDNFINLAELVEQGRRADEVAYIQTIQQLERVCATLNRIYYYPTPVDFSRYWRLGDNQLETISLEEGSGVVMIVDARGFGGEYFPLRLVNTSVELLGQFIYLVQELQDSKAKSSRARLTQIRQLEKKFRILDPKAMEDRSSGFWPTTLEELMYEAEE